MENKLKELLSTEEGHVLIETIIALIAVGAVSFYIVNTDLIPGFRVKWEAINNALQGKWIR